MHTYFIILSLFTGRCLKVRFYFSMPDSSLFPWLKFSCDTDVSYIWNVYYVCGG